MEDFCYYFEQAVALSKELAWWVNYFYKYKFPDINKKEKFNEIAELIVRLEEEYPCYSIGSDDYGKTKKSFLKFARKYTDIIEKHNDYGYVYEKITPAKKYLEYFPEYYNINLKDKAEKLKVREKIELLHPVEIAKEVLEVLRWTINIPDHHTLLIGLYYKRNKFDPNIIKNWEYWEFQEGRFKEIYNLKFQIFIQNINL